MGVGVEGLGSGVCSGKVDGGVTCWGYVGEVYSGLRETAQVRSFLRMWIWV